MVDHTDILSEEGDKTGELKELKIAKRTQQQNNKKEIEENTVSLTFSSPFGKHSVNSRNSSRHTSRPTSKRSSKRISGFDILENISMSGLLHSASLSKTSTNKSTTGDEEREGFEHDRENENLSTNVEDKANDDKTNGKKSDNEKTSADKPDDDNSSEVNNNSDADTSSNDSFGWEDMDAVANHMVYDENGQLQVYDIEHKRRKDHKPLNSNGLATLNQNRKPSIDDEDEEQQEEIDESKNNMFAYTKIDGEEQAKASRKTNAKIDSLLASATLYQRSSINNASKDKLSDSDATENVNLSSEEERSDNEEGDADDDITHKDLTKSNQLNGMKQLLTDNEKFAYAGCAFLLLNQLCADLATRNLNSNMIKDQKLAKRLHNIQKNYGYWKEEIMSKIYYHMEFNEDEIKMIENLGLFPLEINDLMKALKIQRKVVNPYSENTNTSEDLELKEEELKISSTKFFDDDEIIEKAPETVVSIDAIKHKKELDIDVPWSVICDLFLLFLSKGNYDARSRVILKQFANYLSINNEEINQFEKRITETLELEQNEQQKLSRDDLLKKRRQSRKRKKMAYVGLATVGGSLVLGLSGGLLAPVIGAGFAAGLSTVGLTGISGFLSGVGGTATVAATSTAIGANIGASSMSRRMGSVKTFEFKPLHNNRRLNLIISVSGWMTGAEDDVRLPFSTLDPVEGDLYSLYWEPDILKSTGDTMNILASEAITQTIQQVLGATILTALMGAIQVPMALSKLGYLIDNPWNVSLDRAWNSGLILAQYLIEKNLGDRPITLVGFSLGSRVIYYCLRELCKRGATGIIENVIILGAPVVFNKDEMVMCRSVVAGRFVNGYSEKDWILGYLFRATAGGISTVAGLSPVEGEEIENFDCSDIVNGHMGYRKNIPKILKQLGFSILSEEFVEIDDKPDSDRENKQKELIDTLKKLDKNEKKTKSSSWIPKWMKPKKAEWQEMVKKGVVVEDTTSNENKDTEEVLAITTEVPEKDAIETDKPKKTPLYNLKVNNLDSSDAPSSPLSQEGETFSLKLNNVRPRFVSGNVGFALKNAGRSRTSSDINKNSNAENSHKTEFVDKEKSENGKIVTKESSKDIEAETEQSGTSILVSKDSSPANEKTSLSELEDKILVNQPEGSIKTAKTEKEGEKIPIEEKRADTELLKDEVTENVQSLMDEQLHKDDLLVEEDKKVLLENKKVAIEKENEDKQVSLESEKEDCSGFIENEPEVNHISHEENKEDNQISVGRINEDALYSHNQIIESSFTSTKNDNLDTDAKESAENIDINTQSIIDYNDKKLEQSEYERERESEDASSIDAQSMSRINSEIKDSSLELHDIQKPSSPSRNPRFSVDSSFVTANDEYSEKLIDEELTKGFANDAKVQKFQMLNTDNDDCDESALNANDTITQENKDDNHISIENFIEQELNTSDLETNRPASGNKGASNIEEDFEFVQPLRIVESNQNDADDEQRSLQATTSTDYTESETGRRSMDSSGSKKSFKKHKKKKNNKRRK